MTVISQPQTSTALPQVAKVALSSADVPWNPKVRYKKKPSDYVALVIIYGLLIFTVLAMIYPLWFVTISSVSDPSAVANGAVKLIPHGIAWNGYAKVFLKTRRSGRAIRTLLFTVFWALW